MSGAINRSGPLHGSSHCKPGQCHWCEGASTDELQGGNQATLKLTDSAASFERGIF